MLKKLMFWLTEPVMVAGVIPGVFSLYVPGKLFATKFGGFPVPACVLVTAAALT